MIRTISAVLACVGVAACSDLGPEPGLLGELRENRAIWERARPASYVFAVERLCFCVDEARGPVRVSVGGSTVVERVYVDTGTPVPETLAELFPTVDGLFDLLSSGIAGGAFEVSVTYDPVLGVPSDFWIDYAQDIVDEELGMRVTEEVEATASP